MIIAAAPLSIAAQEYVMPLSSDPGREMNISKHSKKNISNELYELPFVDDFSYNSNLPDETRWTDNYAYVNRTYAVGPPTIGTATLDALDQNGAVYPFATINPETFDADYLTSVPINLNYEASDSIYLSFYYQPMGNGLEPRPYDSLCLDFYDPVNDAWINVWQTEGDTLAPFRQVMIPITEERFLKEGFRFGFRNRASLPQNTDYKDKRGNVDHWNIDYVKLDHSRNVNDTIHRDVAFIKPLSSMLKGHESIPWDHFNAAYNSTYLSYFRIEYRNNDTATRNVTRSIQVLDEIDGELYKPGNASAQDIFQNSAVAFEIGSIYPFQFGNGDTASFLIKSWLRTDDFDYKQNDTITRRQVFRDYFAYDDGSAERAYGLRGQGTNNGLIAVRFNSFIADELGGVDIYFTQLLDSLNLGYYFKFMVWDDFQGAPGNLIYDGSTDHTVVYSDVLNKYQRFEFDRTVPVNGTFYVGLLQYNQFLLNIGMDINTDPNNNLLYNLGTDWKISSAPGSLMIRPFVKRHYSSGDAIIPDRKEFMIWPNPATDKITIEPGHLLDHTFNHYRIFDLTGKLVLEAELHSSVIATGSLPEGMYFITLTGTNDDKATSKFIIRR
ncbi:MAG: T9SS type A sorting domain-containing protein [Bacteroidales bacterium]|nr:T9SS type A sorting domain-containing protein [Bacteroidales bacterium]